MIESIVICMSVGLTAFAYLYLRPGRWSAVLLPAYYLCFAILTVMFPAVQSAPKWLYRVLYVLMFIASVALVFRESRRSRPSLREISGLAYFGILVSFCASAFYAPPSTVDFWDPSDGPVARIIVFSLYWIAATQIRERNDVRDFIGATTLCGSIISVWLIGTAWQSGFSDVRALLDVNQSVTAEFIAVGVVPLIHIFFVAKTTPLRRVAQLGVLISMYGAYLTGSRGATVAIGAAALVIAWKNSQVLSRRQIALSLLGITVVSALVLLLPGEENVIQRFLGASEAAPETAARTIVIWPFLIEQLSYRNLEQWLVGEGMNSSSSLLRSVFDIGWGDAHNMYLQALYDQGLVGLGLLLVFLNSVRKRIAEAHGHYQSILYGWFTYLLVIGMTVVEANGKPFWILLGVIATCSSLSKRQFFPLPHRQKATLPPSKLGGVQPELGTTG